MQRQKWKAYWWRRFDILWRLFECASDLISQLCVLIWASTKIKFEELFICRDLIKRKYESVFISKAESNADKLVNIKIVEKLRIKPNSYLFITVWLK